MDDCELEKNKLEAESNESNKSNEVINEYM